MAPPVVAAIIAAASSMIVALFTAVWAFRTSRKLAELGYEFTKQKDFALEQLRIYLKLVVDERTKNIEALRALLVATQTVRDRVRFLSANPSAFLNPATEQDLLRLREQAVDAYAASLLILRDPETMTLAHELKNGCCQAIDVVLAQRDITPSRRSSQIADVMDALQCNQARFRELAHRAADQLAIEVSGKGKD